MTTSKTIFFKDKNEKNSIIITVMCLSPLYGINLLQIKIQQFQIIIHRMKNEP